MKSSTTKRFVRYDKRSWKVPEFFQIRPDILPTDYEQYLNYYGNRCQGESSVQTARRILTGFNAYLEKSNTPLHKISIEQVDSFLALYTKNHALNTCKLYRSILRGFLKYQYQQGRIKKNFAALIISPPEFARSTPPKFLRPNEVQKLFNSLDLSSRRALRAYAMMHLAYYLGLRPKEIILISFNDISFKQKEICIKTRKNFSPIQLPLPDEVIKAITAYILGGRPESKNRRLFLQFVPPCNPVTRPDLSREIKFYMEKNNLSSSAYWLRHSYAQNLLEAGATIYEIKEMMGHKDIESSRKYLSIHINLMRKVIIDETI